MTEPTPDALRRRLDHLEGENLWQEIVGHILGGIPALLLLAGCASLGANRAAEVARTWEGALVYLPPALLHVTPADVPAREPLPTVVYLHGCGGIGWHDAEWARTLAAAGYAVVMPNSFRRQYRPRNCDPVTATAGSFPEAHAMRQEEIDYALTRLRTVPWVDPRNLFLMGHSEGGLAVAQWRGRGFRGHIISAWTCTSPYDPSFDGVWAPPTTPLLAIIFERDPWYRGSTAGSCASKFGGRKDARQVTLPGSGHDTAYSREAREAVLRFLRDHTVR